MYQRQDDGSSTFDKFRSQEAVEIFPEGGSTQGYVETENYNEGECMRLARTAEWSPEYYEQERFNLQNGMGGSTFVAGRELAPKPLPRSNENQPWMK